MAKGKEENVVDIDDEFNKEPDNTNQSEAGTLPDKDKATESEEGATTTAALEPPEIPEGDEVSEQGSEQAAAAAGAEKTWKDFGVDDFEGKSNEEIAAIVRREREDSGFRRRVYGEQADELGTLRTFKTETEAKAKTAAEEKKPDLLEQMPDMTDGEVLDFNKIYEAHPVKAILKYARPVLEQLVQQQLQEAIKGGVKNTITESIGDQRDSLEYASFLQRHDDAETYLPAMKTLDKPEYLGEQSRSYEELFGLAKLNSEKSPLYAPVYQLMAKHPTVSFKEAEQLAKQQMGAVGTAAKKKQDIQQNINKIDDVNSSTTASAKSKTTKGVVTIDQEFEI
ncbi:hypothetical protein ES703_97798 [subsurface metagenome]